MRLHKEGAKDTIDGVRWSDVCAWRIMGESLLSRQQLVTLDRVGRRASYMAVWFYIRRTFPG